MARIRDVPIVLRQVGLWTFGKRVYRQINDDAVFTWGAALAYSWLFAVFPFLVFLLSLVPLVPDRYKPDIKLNVDQLVDQALIGDAAVAVKNQVHGVLDRPSASGFLSFGLILTLWASSGGMAMTMSALDKAYDIDKGRPYYIHRPLAMLLTVVVATLVLLVMVLLPIGTGVLTWLSTHYHELYWLIFFVNIARYVLALLLMFTILAIIYHFGSSLKQKFRPITPGAVFCVAVWLLLGGAFRIYLTRFGGAANYDKTYGAVAGAAILLLFFYIDSLVLLIGAEINSEIDFALRPPPEPETPGPPVPDNS